MNKKQLYESIMVNVSKHVKNALNEGEEPDMHGYYVNKGIYGNLPRRIKTYTLSLLIEELQKIYDTFGDMAVMPDTRNSYGEYTSIYVSKNEPVEGGEKMVTIIN